MCIRDRLCTEYVRAAPGGTGEVKCAGNYAASLPSLIHISEPTRLGLISYADFCLNKIKNFKRRCSRFDSRRKWSMLRNRAMYLQCAKLMAFVPICLIAFSARLSVEQ